MEKVYLYIFDTRKYPFSGLVSLVNLCEKELESLEKYRALEVKKEKLFSLYFKKKYIGEYSLNEHGKPISNNIHFNISHSRGMVVLITSKNREVGVDIEIIKAKDEDLVKYVSSDEEYNFIKNEYDFLSVWTNKESLVKCLGTGIKNDIKNIPSLPLCGKKEYMGRLFYSKIIKINDAIISVTLQSEDDFEYEIIFEKLGVELQKLRDII